MRFPIQVTVLVGISSQVIGLIRAETTVLEVENQADAFVTSSAPSSNYGNSLHLRVGRDDPATTGGAPSGGTRFSYSFFDLREIPSGAEIDSVTLSFVQTNTSTVAGGFDIFEVTSAWSEESITWSNRPADDETQLILNTGTLPTGTYESPTTLELTALVKKWVDQPHTNFGIVYNLRAPSGQPGGGGDTMRSRESDTQAPTLRISFNAVDLTPLPGHQHNPAKGRQSIEDLHISSEGACRFTFSTNDVGSLCVIGWSRNMKEWFPLVQFSTEQQGTEIENLTADSSRFYMATNLPSGVSAAETFDYPIGSGSVDEQIDPERNDIYLSSSASEPFERGATSPDTANWYNYQDVGSYYPTFGGLHGGEDWNKGSGTTDVGEQIKAIANGQIIDIRPAHSAGAAHSGYAVLIRHWLLNGTSIDSLYVHLAPDESSGLPNTGGVIGPESEFSLQEGAPVSKGDVIGVIGAVTSPAMTPHLHFEMRSTLTNPSDLWPNDTGDGYYGPVPGPGGNRSPSITPEEVQAAFLLMQHDGIIDPSDFIDDHR